MKIALDTETTGLDTVNDEILELAIVDEQGNILFNSRFKNVLKDSWPGASRVNGIYPKDLENEKPLSDYQQQIQDILNSAEEVIGYNVVFDVDFLVAAGFEVYGKLNDVMETYKEAIGQRKNLSSCAKYCGYDWKGAKKHGALADTLAALHCYKYLKLFNNSRSVYYGRGKCPGK